MGNCSPLGHCRFSDLYQNNRFLQFPGPFSDLDQFVRSSELLDKGQNHIGALILQHISHTVGCIHHYFVSGGTQQAKAYATVAVGYRQS